MLKKYVAETYSEALLKAKEELGDDISVITSKTINVTKWWGLYERELIEITVMPNKAKSSTSGLFDKHTPKNPVMAEEIKIIDYDLSNQLENKVTIKSMPNNKNNLHSSYAFKTYQDLFKDDYTTNYSNHSRETNKLNPSLYKNSSTSLQKSCIESKYDNSNSETKMFGNDERVEDKRIVELLETINKTLASRQAQVVNKSDQKKGDNKKLDESEEIIKQFYSRLDKIEKLLSNISEGRKNKLPKGVSYIRDKMTIIDMPEHVVYNIIECITKNCSENVLNNPQSIEQEFIKFISENLKISKLNFDKRGNYPAILILIGPTGVGKTTTIAKLAAELGLSSINCKSLALFTTDVYRIGATNQLAQFAQILEAELEIIYQPSDISKLLDKYLDKDIILVDTAGRSQKQESELLELKKLVDAFPHASKFLVLAATAKYCDLLESIKKFGKIGFDHLIFTKLDETNTLGPLLALLLETSASLAYITDGQIVPNDIKSASVEYFINKIFSSNNLVLSQTSSSQ